MVFFGLSAHFSIVGGPRVVNSEITVIGSIGLIVSVSRKNFSVFLIFFFTIGLVVTFLCQPNAFSIVASVGRVLFAVVQFDMSQSRI